METTTDILDGIALDLQAIREELESLEGPSRAQRHALHRLGFTPYMIRRHARTSAQASHLIRHGLAAHSAVRGPA